MARHLKLYFATDVHGSEKCFRKFLHASTVYDADAVILGGDVAGKAIQGITRDAGGIYRCAFRGASYALPEGEELTALEQLISDHGYYPYRADPGELEAMRDAGSLDALFLTLMRERLARWMSMADDRLRPAGTPAFWMLGNDDPPPLREILDDAPWGTQAEGTILQLDGHELLSWGYSNLTPWDSYREMTEDQLDGTLRELWGKLANPERAIANIHVPPFDTGLDEAPVLDRDLRVQQAVGQVKMAPVGSTAVRAILEERQPLLSLHGHIHESHGFRRLGRTLAVNPGSDYGTGALNGVLLTVDADRVRAHQFVRG